MKFPLLPFYLLLNCSILGIIFLSAVFTIRGLPECLEKSCFTHESKIIKGYQRDTVAHWVLPLGMGPRSGWAEPEDFADNGGTLSLSNRLPRWRWQRMDALSIFLLCLPVR